MRVRLGTVTLVLCVVALVRVLAQSNAQIAAPPVPLDGRAHLLSQVRQWLGDARGRWDGDTLVVETTNFTAKTAFRGASDQLHLVERFTRVSPETLLYEFTATDPSTWTQPWSVALPMTRTADKIHEYVCHEGNVGLASILAGARAQERSALRHARVR